MAGTGVHTSNRNVAGEFTHYGATLLSSVHFICIAPLTGFKVYLNASLGVSRTDRVGPPRGGKVALHLGATLRGRVIYKSTHNRGRVVVGGEVRSNLAFLCLGELGLKKQHFRIPRDI